MIVFLLHIVLLFRYNNDNASNSSSIISAFSFGPKLIILDNASSHRNPKVKEVINKDNHLLYAVPYQHFTNSIENYFSMLKSRLQKLDGLTHAELKENITNTIINIPKEKYMNIIKGAYERPEKYISKKNNTRKIKKNYL